MTITHEEAKKALQDHGLSIAQFAKTHGFNVHLVYQALANKNKAGRGESHRIAVALGLKPKPSSELPPAIQDLVQFNAKKSKLSGDQSENILPNRA